MQIYKLQKTSFIDICILLYVRGVEVVEVKKKRFSSRFQIFGLSRRNQLRREYLCATVVEHKEGANIELRNCPEDEDKNQVFLHNRVRILNLS